MAALGTQPCNEDVVNLLVDTFRSNAQTPEQRDALSHALRTISGLRQPGDEHQWVVQALDLLLRAMIRTGLGGSVDAVLSGSGCQSAKLSGVRLEALAPDDTWTY